MTIELNIYTDTPNPTERRIFEMLTENTGTHFLDSGGNSGRAWQRNQTLTASQFMERPKATLDIEYGIYPTLDLFHFLNDRVTLTEKAKGLQSDFEEFINDDPERSFYSPWDMEQFVQELTESKEVRVANSCNWDNFLNQVIQYVSFEYQDNHFVILQVHGGADVRGGYTRPQVFATSHEFAFYDMTDASIQCTNKDCAFTLDVFGMSDVTDLDGALWDGNFYELKECPECNGQLEALAPEAQKSW